MRDNPEGTSGAKASNWRHNLLVFEVLLFLFPVTVCAAAGTLWTVFASSSFGPFQLALALVVATAYIAPLICAWKLCVSYTAGGSARLVGLHQAWWYGAGLGVLVAFSGAIAGAGLFLFADAEPSVTERLAEPVSPLTLRTFALTAFGLPLLLPLAHVWLERRRAAATA